MAIFRAIWNKIQREGWDKHSKEGHDFIRQSVGKLYSRPQADKFIQSSQENLVTRLTIGKMYLFTYDAKWKDELPYWDKYPLIFPIEMYDDGFLGINMHYLPPLFRAILMDNLYSLLSDKKYNERTRLKLSYDILKGAAKFRYFEPTVKRYLYGHVRSKFLNIPIDEWTQALYIPLQSFQKATSREVWADSRAQITGKKRRKRK